MADEDTISPSEEYLNRLVEKAEVNREKYSIKYQYYQRLSDVLLFFVILLGTLVATISIADVNLFSGFIPTTLLQSAKNLITICGFFIFIFSIADRIWNVQGNKAQYEMGVKSSTEFIRICHRVKKIDLPNMSYDQIVDRMEYLQNHYTMQQYLLPLTSDGGFFLKGKKSYLLKKKASIELEDNPEMDIKPILKKLKRL
jgi:hypothetical protein